MRKVRGADKGGIQAGLPLEQPGLGVEFGRPRVEGHPDFRAEREQLIYCTLLGRAHIGGGDHPDLATALHHVLQRVPKVPDPGPDDESTNEIHPVSGCELCLQLRSNVRLALCVDQEIALAEWSRRGRR